MFAKFVIKAERSWTFREQGQHQRQARVDSLTETSHHGCCRQNTCVQLCCKPFSKTYHCLNAYFPPLQADIGFHTFQIYENQFTEF